MNQVMSLHRCTWFLPNCQNQIQRLLKDFQEPYKRTELNQTGTFISICKQVQFTFDNLTPSSINQKLELLEKCINSCHWIQLLRTDFRLTCSVTAFPKIKFKDFQVPCLFSRTFQALKIWRKKFKDFHGPTRALGADWQTDEWSRSVLQPIEMATGQYTHLWYWPSPCLLQLQVHHREQC